MTDDLLKSIEMEDGPSEAADAVAAFMEAFEVVFDGDWEYTKELLENNLYVSEKGTFLRPQVSDETNNWCCRGHLLAAYRRLSHVLSKHGIYDATP